MAARLSTFSAAMSCSHRSAQSASCRHARVSAPLCTGSAGRGLPSVDAQPEALHEAGHGLGAHLQAVALAERRKGRGLQLCCPHLRCAAQLDKLGEEALEARGGDYLKDPCGLIAVVPECVPLAARLEDEVARFAAQHLIPQQRTDPSFDHEAVLILAAVAMKRGRQSARRHRMLHKREALAAL